MAELEIDQSNLPRVREVCQCFAVLEDGALAHNLQEQEIEKYYTTNIQKNQLVQNDIRVAKRLQDEEEELRDQQRDVIRQTSRQMEEQDFEYARVIQEEIQRSAEEARRREIDDEELAKQIQEEELNVRRRSREQDSHCEGNSSSPALLSPHQYSHRTPLLGEEQCSASTTVWQCSPSSAQTDLIVPHTGGSQGAPAQKTTNSWSNQRHAEPTRGMGNEHRVSLSDGSDDSDADFVEQLSMWSRRLYERPNTALRLRRDSAPHSQEQSYTNPRSSYIEELRECDEEREEVDEENNENDYLQRTPLRYQENSYREVYEGEHRNGDPNSEPPSSYAGESRCRRSESLRLQDRTKDQSRGFHRTGSYKGYPDRRVHFQEENRQPVEQRQVWEMLGQILIERGVPVRFGGSGAPLQIKPQSRDSQVLHGSVVSCGDSPPHQRVFQRASSARHSFHGDMREWRRSSYWENSRRDHREDQDRRRENGEFYEISQRNSSHGNRERQGSRRRREHTCDNNDKWEEGEREHYRVRRTERERGHWRRTAEERLSSEKEQEVGRRTDQPPRRALHQSQSLRSRNRPSSRERSRFMAAGTLLPPKPSLDLRELHQVLEDEELARKLQDEEENLLLRNSPSSPRKCYPTGDFRVAQVAQDEEIARFMQKQEIRSRRRSRELEGPSSWREHRAMISHQDRRTARERHVPRERLDSEGLPSPTEDGSPENQPPSPISTLPPAHQIRNIAEELDPTYQSRRPDVESLRGGLTGPSCQSPPSQPSDVAEEPTFIPPTKRQTEKATRSKPKEKKENCKQQ